MGEAIERWATLVRARREQMDAQLASIGGPPRDWWAARAPSFTHGLGDVRQVPAFGLPQMVDRLERSDTVLDIGAGPGRYAVPLARVTRHVTLVEPSAGMAAGAREAFARAELENYTLIERSWPSPRVPPATAVLIAHVLSPIEDIATFIQRARDHAERWLFIVHGTVVEASDAVGRVIRAFHGTPRVPQPDIAELLPVLRELGIAFEVTMGERRFPRRYATAADAARDVASTALVEQTPRALRRVQSLLARELRPLPDGRVALPTVVLPVALMVARKD